MLDLESARQRLAAHGQEHVLRWYDQLDSKGRSSLLAQIERLDLNGVERALATPFEKVDGRDLSPYLDVIEPHHEAWDQSWTLGEKALRAGRVGTILVAGGQGTRLGFAGPKGAFPLGAVSGRTLYQIHVERLVALGRRYGVVPPLYVMTSEANHDATAALFAAHDNYGLPEERLIIFRQGLAPAVDETGKLLLDAPDHIVMSPNGNGGLFRALSECGALAHMEQMGVDTISYIQVDNPLALSCDPRFVGYHLLCRSEFSCKAIQKLGPDEKVGNYARVKGHLRIVEYTDIPVSLAEKTDAKGELLFRFSNPGLYIWSREFAARQAGREDLPFHKAHKKIPHLDETGNLVQPTAPCGYKLEAFAMDTLPDAERSVVLSSDRHIEFAPVKNASGPDSPDSARALMNRLYASWIIQAGGRILHREVQIEISALYALDAEELAEKLSPGYQVRGDLYLFK